MKRLFAIAGAVIVVLACGIVLAEEWITRVRAASVTSEILRRESLAFLVTDRVVTQVVVRPPGERGLKTLLLGTTDGVLIAKVSVL